MEPLEALIAALLQPIPIRLASEAQAIRLVVDARWPDGIPRCPVCGRARTLVGFRLHCPTARCRRRPTIFCGTHLEHLRRPDVRAILYALRAMVLDKRSIGARPLAALFGISHVTLWRHLLQLRQLFPYARGRPRENATGVMVCGRTDRVPAPARVIVDRIDGTIALQAAAGDAKLPYAPLRLVAENIRAMLNGTFHGVTSRYLGLYMEEACARFERTPRETLTYVIKRLFASVPPIVDD